MSPADPREIVLCIAPHPDDETLGCGGTLLRHVAEGAEVHWLIVTSMDPARGFTPERIARRDREIEEVALAYGFTAVHRTHLPTTRLDTLPKSDLVTAISQVVQKVLPRTMYVPYRNDAHSDHAAVFDAAVACTKSFRYPSIRKVLAYETLSETEFGMRTDDPGFRPNVFVDTSAWIDRKIGIMERYAGEMAPFPFPRSRECLQAQATLRGSQAGVSAAEAFMLLKEIR